MWLSAVLDHGCITFLVILYKWNMLTTHVKNVPLWSLTYIYYCHLCSIWNHFSVLLCMKIFCKNKGRYLKNWRKTTEKMIRKRVDNSLITCLWMKPAHELNSRWPFCGSYGVDCVCDRDIRQVDRLFCTYESIENVLAWHPAYLQKLPTVLRCCFHSERETHIKTGLSR